MSYYDVSNASQNQSRQTNECFSFPAMNQINDERCDYVELHVNIQVPSMWITLKHEKNKRYGRKL